MPDEVDQPRGSTEATVAVEIRGDSLGPFLNRWLVFYDDVHRPVTSDLIGELCVVGLADGRVLVKQIQRGRAEGLFNLNSSTEKPILDVAIEWAAKVNSIQRRHQLTSRSNRKRSHPARSIPPPPPAVAVQPDSRPGPALMGAIEGFGCHRPQKRTVKSRTG
jgi:hypothetical protein